MNDNQSTGQTEVKSDEKPNPAPIPERKPTCANIAQRQNTLLNQKCTKKVNSLSCRCSGCRSDNNYPVITSPSDAPLLNTAYDGSGGVLLNGSTDLHWEIGLGDPSGPGSVGSWNPATVYFNPAWSPSPFSNANWLGNNDPAFVHVYFRYRFNLGSAVNPSSFALSMDFCSDDQVQEIYVNGVAQSTQPNGTGIIPGGGFRWESRARISLDNSWKRCDNEIIVHVWSNGGNPMGLLVQNSVQVEPDNSGCDCPCDCEAVKFPDIQPCISVKWGDSACDCIETDDVEVLCVTVCNCFSNVAFNNFSIGQIIVTDTAGNPVPTLPDGTPSVQVIPSGPICFGDIGPCKDKENPSCVSRELVLYTRGAVGKNYRLAFSGICFTVCHQYQSEQCFTMTLCADK